MEAHRHNNTGIEEVSWFKAGNGRDRVLVGFDLDAGLAPPGVGCPSASPVRKAKLRMVVWAESKPENNFTANGLNVGVWRVIPHWEEGNGRWDRILDNFSTDPEPAGPPDTCGQPTGDNPNCPYMQETFHCGLGATWTCGQDTAIENDNSGTLSGSTYSGCNASGNNWSGGEIGDTSACPPDPDPCPGKCNTAGCPSSCTYHPCHSYLQSCSQSPNNPEKPECDTYNADLGKSPPDASACAAHPDDECYDMSVADFTCTYRTVDCNENEFSSRIDLAEWDVTADLNAVICDPSSPTNGGSGSAQRKVVSWVISKFLEAGDSTTGKVRYFSRDGARFWYQKGLPNADQLVPQLLIDTQ